MFPSNMIPQNVINTSALPAMSGPLGGIGTQPSTPVNMGGLQGPLASIQGNPGFPNPMMAGQLPMAVPSSFAPLASYNPTYASLYGAPVQQSQLPMPTMQTGQPVGGFGQFPQGNKDGRFLGRLPMQMSGLFSSQGQSMNPMLELALLRNRFR